MDIQRASRKNEIRRRRILWGALAVVAVVLVSVGLARLEPAAPSVDADALWISRVERGEMLRQVRGPGTLVPETEQLIAAETNGLVERILILPGTEVGADSIILELSDSELEQAAQTAEFERVAAVAELADLQARLESQILDQEANTARASFDHESAEIDLEANEELSRNGLVPEVELKRTRIRAKQTLQQLRIEEQRVEKLRHSVGSQLDAQRSRLRQFTTQAELRRSQVEKLAVRAGIDGVLQWIPVEVGQRVTPGEPLARVADPTRLKAELRVPETQAKDVTIGQKATVDTRNGVVQGRVVRVDPAVQNGTVTVDVALLGDLPKGARPDLSVDGTIEIERLEDVLYVGRPAYGQSHQTVSLFRLDPDGDEARRAQVELGRSSVSIIEVVSGLAEGDRVILSDTSNWDDFQRIRLD